MAFSFVLGMERHKTDRTSPAHTETHIFTFFNFSNASGCGSVGGKDNLFGDNSRVSPGTVRHDSLMRVT